MLYISLKDTRRRNSFSLLLGVFWIIGLLTGFLICVFSSANLSEYSFRIAEQPLSILGILASVFLPFIICFFGGLIGSRFLICAGAFLTAFTSGYTLFLIRSAFGSAGWLLCLLLMFSRVISGPLLLWYSLICSDSDRGMVFRKSVCVFAVLIITSFFDYLIVSPFLIFVMKYI